MPRPEIHPLLWVSEERTLPSDRFALHSKKWRPEARKMGFVMHWSIQRPPHRRIQAYISLLRSIKPEQRTTGDLTPPGPGQVVP